MSEQPKCELCGEPMPPGEEMFKFHGYSGPCPAPIAAPEPAQAGEGPRAEFACKECRLQLAYTARILGTGLCHGCAHKHYAAYLNGDSTVHRELASLKERIAEMLSEEAIEHWCVEEQNVWVSEAMIVNKFAAALRAKLGGEK